MRKALPSFLLAGFLLLAPVIALGNQITLSFVLGSPGDVSASPSGVTVGPSDSVDVLMVRVTRDRARVLSTYPVGSGAMLSDVGVTFVSPAVLAVFDLGPAFSPDGSESLTFGDANLVGTDIGR